MTPPPDPKTPGFFERFSPRAQWGVLLACSALLAAVLEISRLAGRAAPGADACGHRHRDQRRQHPGAARAGGRRANHRRVSRGARDHGRHRGGLPQGLAAVSGRGAGHRCHERGARLADRPLQGAARNDGGVGHGSGRGLGHDGDVGRLRRGPPAGGVHAVPARGDRGGPGVRRCAGCGSASRLQRRTSFGFHPWAGGISRQRCSLRR